jgi:hypothetical protein
MLKASTSKLLDAMGEMLGEIRLRIFWAQMNGLRHRLEVDFRVRDSLDPESPPLPEEVAGLLHDLVDSLNIFSAHEPKLVVLDELKRDPAQRVSNESTLSAAREIADAALRSPQGIDPQAARLLSEIVHESGGSGPAAERAKEFSAKSSRNLILEAVRRTYKAVASEMGAAWKSFREGAYQLVGSVSVTYALAVLIKSNETAVRTLIDTLGGSATLHKIVDVIINLFP